MLMCEMDVFDRWIISFCFSSVSLLSSFCNRKANCKIHLETPAVFLLLCSVSTFLNAQTCPCVPGSTSFVLSNKSSFKNYWLIKPWLVNRNVVSTMWNHSKLHWKKKLVQDLFWNNFTQKLQANLTIITKKWQATHSMKFWNKTSSVFCMLENILQ